MAQHQAENHVEDREDQATQSQCQTQWFQYESQPISQAVWGRLKSKHSRLKSLGKRKSPIIIIINTNSSLSFDLCKPKFTVGRGTTNDLILTNQLDENVMARVSKVHFEISRDLSSPLNPVYITDLSLNGTYVNQQHLGKGKKRILKSGDAISLAHPSYKTFIFKDLHLNLKCTQIPDVIINKYYISDVLGSGGCGTVYKIYNLRTLNAYAMKVITKNLISEKQRKINDAQQIRNEVNIMESLQHPCIIKMHDIFDTPEAVYIILELMKGGDLLHRITENSHLTEMRSKFFFYQICQAVKHLHELGITHRDIKPDNILLQTSEEETVLKVSDFGLSKYVHNDTVMRTICGTPSYVAPEVVNTNGRGAYTKKVDIWSLGVVLFTCLSGVLPFANNCDTTVCEQIKKGRFNFKHKSWKSVSETAKNLIRKMLTVNATDRPNINDILKHEWFTKDPKVIRSAMRVMKIEPVTEETESDDENFLEPPAKRAKLLQ